MKCLKVFLNRLVHLDWPCYDYVRGNDCIDKCWNALLLIVGFYMIVIIIGAIVSALC